ncbi:MAG: hypothetical protein H6753_02760 [Candidatus Omnitrophica bacterium]|nr:hypothetical protein [Candidatus Omnitrophota bacterium]
MKTIILAGLAGVFLFGSVVVFAQTSELKVDIVVKGDAQKVVPKDDGHFTVTTKIINISDMEQKIKVWSCNYDLSWAGSMGVVIESDVCEKNIPQDIVLKPKEDYVRDLQLKVSENVFEGPVVFKLGFDPKAASSLASKVSDKIIWSEPAMIRTKVQE